jgi:beta-galactosidase
VYIGADLDMVSLARVLQTLSGMAGVKPPLEVPAGVELTVRKAGDKQWIFVLNHTSTSQSVSIPKTFTDLLTGETQTGKIDVSAFGVRVLQASQTIRSGNRLRQKAGSFGSFPATSIA